MHHQKMVVCVKHNGRVLREQNEQVTLPFGSEFSLYFKNLNSVRALISVQIDGKDVTGGTQLIVPANSAIDLERFIENGNFERGHKFKFIERTAKIEAHRGVGGEDGLVRVQIEYERIPAPIVNTWYNPYNYPMYGGSRGSSLRTLGNSGAAGMAGDSLYRGVVASSAGDASVNQTNASATKSLRSCGSQTAAYSANSVTTSGVASNSMDEPKNDAGITVAGSTSEQKFTTGAWFPTDGQKHVMVLKLIGQVNEQPVQAPVTVKTKQVCSTCGTSNKIGTKFCRECGTALTVL